MYIYLLLIKNFLTTYSVPASPHFDIIPWILWPIFYIYFSLMGLCLHILYVRPSGDLFCIHTSCVRPSGDLFFIHTSCVRPSGDLFCIHTSYLVTYSLHSELLECLSFTHTYFHMFDLFSKSITCLWPRWTLLNFMAYFVYLLHLGELIFTYFIAKCVCTSCDLFCTRKLSFWCIVYTKNFLMAYSLQFYCLLCIVTSP